MFVPYSHTECKEICMREMGLIDINQGRYPYYYQKRHSKSRQCLSFFNIFFLSELVIGFDSIDFLGGKLCTETVSGFFNRVCN